MESPDLNQQDFFREKLEEEENPRVGFCFTCRHRSNLFLLFYLFVLGLYLSLGALVFSFLEQPLEKVERKRFEDIKSAFLKKHPCVNATEFNSLLHDLESTTGNGVSLMAEMDSSSNWNFIQSLFFCFTVLTTIGYGRNTPLSDVGKGFCIFYGMLGIPLTIVMFTALAERVYGPVAAVREYLRERFEPLGHSEFQVKLFHFIVYILLLAVVFFFVPAAVLLVLEPQWHYLDALYYCFISLTTVGLGDFVPDNDPNRPSRDIYKFGVIVYLLVGLTFIILCIRLAGDLPELHPGRRIYPGDTGARQRFNSMWNSIDEDDMPPAARLQTLDDETKHLQLKDPVNADYGSGKANPAAEVEE